MVTPTQDQTSPIAASQNRQPVSVGVLPLPIRDAPPATNLIGDPGTGGNLFRHRIPHSDRSYLVLLHVYEPDIAQHVVVLYSRSIFLLPNVLFHVSSPRRILEPRCCWQAETNKWRQNRRKTNKKYFRLCQPRDGRPQVAGLLDLSGCWVGKIHGSKEGMDLPCGSPSRPGHLRTTHSLCPTPLWIAETRRPAPFDTYRCICGDLLCTSRPGGLVPWQPQNRQHCHHGHLPDAPWDFSMYSKLESVELRGLLLMASLPSIGLGRERK